MINERFYFASRRGPCSHLLVRCKVQVFPSLLISYSLDTDLTIRPLLNIAPFFLLEQAPTIQ